MVTVYKLTFFKQLFFYININTPCLSFLHAQRNAETKKGPHFKEVECNLSVYLSLLVNGLFPTWLFFINIQYYIHSALSDLEL